RIAQAAGDQPDLVVDAGAQAFRAVRIEHEVGIDLQKELGLRLPRAGVEGAMKRRLVGADDDQIGRRQGLPAHAGDGALGVRLADREQHGGDVAHAARRSSLGPRNAAYSASTSSTIFCSPNSITARSRPLRPMAVRIARSASSRSIASASAATSTVGTNNPSWP